MHKFNCSDQSDQNRFHFAEGLHLPNGKPNDLGRLKDEVENLQIRLARLMLAMGTLLKQRDELVATIEKLNEQNLKSAELLEKVLVPLAEQNRELRNREVDFKIIHPIALKLIQIIDRQSAELSGAEQGVLAFDAVENCRAADRQELLDILGVLDIEPFRSLEGAKVDIDCHTVIHARPTDKEIKVGRVARVVRPGYLRRNDRWIIRPVWVEAWKRQSAKHS